MSAVRRTGHWCCVIAQEWTDRPPAAWAELPHLDMAVVVVVVVNSWRPLVTVQSAMHPYRMLPRSTLAHMSTRLARAASKLLLQDQDHVDDGVDAN
jgi:hypothetical protein